MYILRTPCERDALGTKTWKTWATQSKVSLSLYQPVRDQVGMQKNHLSNFCKAPPPEEPSQCSSVERSFFK